MRQSVASEMGVKDLIGELLILIEDTPPPSSSSASSSSSSSFRRSMTSLMQEHKRWSQKVSPLKQVFSFNMTHIQCSFILKIDLTVLLLFWT